MKKLMRRGHDRARFEDLADRYPFSSRIEMLSKAPADKCKAVVPLKLKQFEGLQSLRVGAVLRKYMPLLGVFADKIVPMPCTSRRRICSG